MNGDAAYWKAKYQALAAGIQHDPKLIEGAEKLVQTAMNLAISNIHPFETVWSAVYQIVVATQPRPCPVCTAKALEGFHQATEATTQPHEKGEDSR